MWFKQAQFFQLAHATPSTPDAVRDALSHYAFQGCLPSMSYTVGWAPIIDEAEAPLSLTVNGCTMICLQTEEKILPAIVIRQELEKKIKEIESEEGRKIYHKEKQHLKDELLITLMPRAFTKISKIYAYIDGQHNRLVLGTTNAKKTEQFLVLFKKTFGDVVDALEISKISPILTAWLQQKHCPATFSIEKACVLQDVQQQRRVIRCREQDLLADNILSFLQDGCEVKQLAMNWQDRVDFMVLDDLSLQSIKYSDEIIQQVKDMEAGTLQQQFCADFLLMTETLVALFNDLYEACQSLTASASTRQSPALALAS